MSTPNEVSQAILKGMLATRPPDYWRGARDECTILAGWIRRDGLDVTRILDILETRAKLWEQSSP